MQTLRRGVLGPVGRNTKRNLVSNNGFISKAATLLLENKPDHPWIIFCVDQIIREKIEKKVEEINQMPHTKKQLYIAKILGQLVNTLGGSGSRSRSGSRGGSKQNGGMGIIALISVIVTVGIATVYQSDITNNTKIEYMGITYNKTLVTTSGSMFVSDSDFSNREFIQDIDLTKFKHAAEIAKMTAGNKKFFEARKHYIYLVLLNNSNIFTNFKAPQNFLPYDKPPQTSQTSNEVAIMGIKDVVKYNDKVFDPKTFVDEVREKLSGSVSIDKSRLKVVENWISILKYNNNITDDIDQYIVPFAIAVFDEKYSDMPDASKLQGAAVFALNLHEHNKKTGLTHEVDSELVRATFEAAKDSSTSASTKKVLYFVCLYFAVLFVLYILDRKFSIESFILGKKPKEDTNDIINREFVNKYGLDYNSDDEKNSQAITANKQITTKAKTVTEEMKEQGLPLAFGSTKKPRDSSRGKQRNPSRGKQRKP